MEAIEALRSVREFTGEPVSDEEPWVVAGAPA